MESWGQSPAGNGMSREDIVGIRYQETSSEDIEVLESTVVRSKVRELIREL